MAGADSRAQSVTEQRENAVRHARAGHMGEAQATLRGLLAAGTDDGLVAMDLVTLLQQDGKNAEAAALFAGTSKADPPAYALLAAARANQAIGRHDEARRLAREGARRFPADPAWTRLQASSPVESPAAAMATPTVSRLMASGDAHRKAGDLFAALAAYTAAIKLAPTDPAPRREAAAVMIALGGPHGAAMIAGDNPTVSAAQAAAMVRWGIEVQGPDPARRFDGTDAALARLDALLASTPPEDRDLRRQLRLDRLVALAERVRMAEAAQEGDELRRDGPLPIYAEQAYGEALLYMRRRQEARAAYDHILESEPHNIQARYGQFFAAVELEDFPAAYAAVDVLLSRDEPIWRRYVDDNTRYANPERTAAEIAAADARFYGNQLGEAWDRISVLAKAAPANGLVRVSSAQIANARGWPRLAEAEAEIAISLAPDELGAKIMLVEVALANFRYTEANRLVAELVALYPEDSAVKRVARQVRAQQGWLLEVEARPSNSIGGGVNETGQALQVVGRLYSPPIADNWRIFALNDYVSANPIEGFAQRERAGVGVELRLPELRATAFPTMSWGTLNRAGGGATLDWFPTDHISLGVSAEAFTLDTPLRALFYGITSDQYVARAAYRWHESRALAGVVSYQPFTDGNQRLTAGLTYTERLIDIPKFDLTGRADLFTSSNTLGINAPYFNPSADLSATVGFLAEHVAWRYYETSFTQALRVDAGLYAQQGYANDWIGIASYEHRWRIDPRTEFRYGIQASRRVYDGIEEKSYGLIVGLRQRI
jgi:biofilm PGA synthesis protein PgaA